MSTPELQALLANLRPRSQAPSNSSTTPVAQSPAAFHSASAVPSSPPPPFSPSPMSTNPTRNTATAQNLLSLLNFSPAPIPPAEPDSHQLNAAASPASTGRQGHEPIFTTADLLAKTTSSQPRSPNPQSSATQGSVQKDAEQKRDTNAVSTAQEGSTGIFTYKNPFEALRASRPHTPRTSQVVTETTLHQSVNAIEQEQAQEQEQEQLAQQDIATSFQDPNPRPSHTSPMPERVKLLPKSQALEQTTPPQTQSNGYLDTPVADTSTAAEGNSNNVQKERPVLNGTLRDTGGGSGSNNPEAPRVVPVLSFPVKAFVSITLQLKAPASSKVREDAVMEISRLKKDFDQIDRSLAAASSKFITYALVKNGGMRIIRQDDGKDRHVFKHTHDRIFNVSLCTSSLTQPTSDHQAVLGTGVSGAVYYATLSKADEDFFDSNSLETESLIFPAYPPGDENTAGGVLKTRAKRSSRHPEFFAIGRGKSIHVVWPSTVMTSKYGISPENREVDTSKFFKERSLQILTGKAGKDFTFSEDDTMIVSLDKTGRLRFWDVRKLVDGENARAMQITPYIIDTPILSLATASPAEKSWPTSVLFLDKARPYTRGGALRYVLVGLRQNHTLQLWDIALGKAVQEINFPHENETDGICSVAYHPASGIIVVGHPTRNSIFFIHLSAPRYTLSSSLTQATYVQRVAAKDPDIPKPESTACMSGIREISFEGRGQLRSVELLPIFKSAENAQADSAAALFELYVAHSTGVTCLVISKEDLGWDAENKIIHNVNAEQDGLVVLKELRLGSIIEESGRSKSPPQETPGASKSKKKKDKKAKETSEESVLPSVDVDQEPVPLAEASNSQPIGPEPVIADPPPAKESKKEKKKKKESAAEPGPKQDHAKKDTALSSTDDAAVPSRQPTPSHKPGEPLSMSISGDWLDKELKKVERAVSHEFKKELDTLYQNIKTDRTSQDQASASRQETVLRLVSQTLNTNVESSLAHILRKQMEEVVVPALADTVSKNLSQQITTLVSQTIKKEVGSELPIQLDRTLQSPQMLTRIADNISTRLTESVKQEVVNAVSTSIATSMKTLAFNTASEAVAAAEMRMSDQVAHIQQQHATFNSKIEELNGALHTVAETLQSMSQAQAAFQSQVLEDRRVQAQENVRAPSPLPVQASSPVTHVRAAAASPASQQKSKAEIEVEEVTLLMEQRKYEEGSIKWLQSSQPVKLFDDLFSRYTPDYLATDVSPLVAFSIGVTVANSLSTNTERRLEWIDAAFDTVDFKDREIIELAQHGPQLLGGLLSKLEALYIQRAQNEPYAAVVQKLSPLILKVRSLIDSFRRMSQGQV